jgi:hypothetical protein
MAKQGQLMDNIANAAFNNDSGFAVQRCGVGES